MIQTETNIDVSSLEDLDFEMNDACEHSQHNEHPLFHAGKGEWWRTHFKCPGCGASAPPQLMCDKWKRSIDANPYELLGCNGPSGCGDKFFVKDYGMVWVRKDDL